MVAEKSLFVIDTKLIELGKCCCCCRRIKLNFTMPLLFNDFVVNFSEITLLQPQQMFL